MMKKWTPKEYEGGFSTWQYMEDLEEEDTSELPSFQNY